VKRSCRKHRPRSEFGPVSDFDISPKADFVVRKVNVVLAPPTIGISRGDFNEEALTMERRRE